MGDLKTHQTMRAGGRFIALALLSLALVVLAAGDAEDGGIFDRFAVKNEDSVESPLTTGRLTDMLKHPMEFSDEKHQQIATPGAISEINALEDAWALPQGGGHEDAVQAANQAAQAGTQAYGAGFSQALNVVQRAETRTSPLDIEAPTEVMVSAGRSSIIHNKLIWSDNAKGCHCKAVFKPVCAVGENFRSACAAKCRGHKKWTHGMCKKSHVAQKNGMVQTKKGPKKKGKRGPSKACLNRLKRMKKWAHRRTKKAAKAFKKAAKYKVHAKMYKNQCTAHRATLATHATYSVACKLMKKYQLKAAKNAKKAAYHTKKAAMWARRHKKKACFQGGKVNNKKLISGKKFGHSPHRVSLKWSKFFIKKYEMRWPHCVSLKCYPFASRAVLERACHKNRRCTGFSFSADKRIGKGCLKNCFHKEFNGYGSISYDYWIKRTETSPQIFGSANGPTFYKNCFFNGQDTFRWHGEARTITRPETPWVKKIGMENDSLSGLSVPKGWCVRLYEHANFKGHSLSIAGPQNAPCLKEFRMHGKESWDNKASSFRIYPNSHCVAVPLKKMVKKIKKKPVDHRLPDEHEWYWGNSKLVHKEIEDTTPKSAKGKKKGKFAKKELKKLAKNHGTGPESGEGKKKGKAKKKKKKAKPGPKYHVNPRSKNFMKKKKKVPKKVLKTLAWHQYCNVKTKLHAVKGKCRAYKRFCKLYRDFDMPLDAQHHCDNMKAAHAKMVKAAQKGKKKKGKKKGKKKKGKKKGKKKKKKALATNYMALMLDGIFKEQPKEVQASFKKAGEWCLHFHEVCRTALHKKLLQTEVSEMAAPTEELQVQAKAKAQAQAKAAAQAKADATMLASLKHKAALADVAVKRAKQILVSSVSAAQMKKANDAVAKARAALAQAEQKKKKKAKENLNKYAEANAAETAAAADAAA